MFTEEIFYGIRCDRCGEQYESSGDYSYMTDKGEIIIQQGDDHSLFEQCYVNSGKHIAMLLDKSGGQGIDTPIGAPAYAPKVHLGFAGGINPDNVIDKMREITRLHVGRFWIDMESGVRTDDRFDLDKVEDVCKKVYDEFLTIKA